MKFQFKLNKALGLLVLLLSSTLIFTTLPITVLAADNAVNVTDGSTQTHNGAITTTSKNVDGLTVNNKSTVTQTGDIITSGDGASGVKVSGNSKVTVNGNIKTTGNAYTDETTSEFHEANSVSADDTSDVTVNGNVDVSGENSSGIISFEKSNITVNGNINATNSTVGADAYGGTVNVNGNVTAKGNDAVALSATTYSLGTDDSNNDDPELSNKAAIFINGNALSDNIGISLDRYSKVVVNGTLKGENNALYIITWEDEDDNEQPTIIVKNLETGKNGNLIEVWKNFDISEKDGQRNTDMEKKVLSNIQYIIDANGFTVTGAKTITENGKTYLVAKEGENITLTPKVNFGSQLIETNFGTYLNNIKNNDDGTYTLTVARGGNLVFSATTKKIATNDLKQDIATLPKKYNVEKISSADTVRYHLKDTNYNNFKGVAIDGVTVDPTNYKVLEGSTNVIFNKSFIDSLSAGNHEIAFVFNDGIATTSIQTDNNEQQQTNTDNSKIIIPDKVTNSKNTSTVSNNKANNVLPIDKISQKAIKTSNNTTGVQTGDNTQIAFWISLIVFASAGISGVMIAKRKKS